MFIQKPVQNYSIFIHNCKTLKQPKWLPINGGWIDKLGYIHAMNRTKQ